MSLSFTIRHDLETFSTNDQPEGKVVQCDVGHISNLKAGRTIAVKVPGYKHDFGSNGNLFYIPAEYQVYRITKADKAGLLISGHAELIIDFPVRQRLETKSE